MADAQHPSETPDPEFPIDVTLPSGAIRRGNPDSFPIDVTLPSGRIYRGNPDQPTTHDKDSP